MIGFTATAFCSTAALNVTTKVSGSMRKVLRARMPSAVSSSKVSVAASVVASTRSPPAPDRRYSESLKRAVVDASSTRSENGSGVPAGSNSGTRSRACRRRS